MLWLSSLPSQSSARNSSKSTPFKSLLKALKAPLHLKAKKSTCITKVPSETELSSTPVSTEDSLSISTSVSVKSSSAGMKSDSAWKSEPKSKCCAPQKLLTEAEQSAPLLPTQIFTSSWKESNDCPLQLYCFIQSMNLVHKCFFIDINFSIL